MMRQNKHIEVTKNKGTYNSLEANEGRDEREGWRREGGENGRWRWGVLMEERETFD